MSAKNIQKNIQSKIKSVVPKPELHPLELRIMSAKDLKKVTLFSRKKAYIAVSILDHGVHPIQTFKTLVDWDGGSNPAWNFPVKFTVDEAAARQDRLRLLFQIQCDGVFRDKYVGGVSVSVQELLDSPAAATTPHKADEPVTAYPAAFPPTMGPSSAAYLLGPMQPMPNWPPENEAYPPPPAAAAAYPPPPPPAYG